MNILLDEFNEKSHIAKFNEIFNKITIAEDLYNII